MPKQPPFSTNLSLLTLLSPFWEGKKGQSRFLLLLFSRNWKKLRLVFSPWSSSNEIFSEIFLGKSILDIFKMSIFDFGKKKLEIFFIEEFFTFATLRKKLRCGHEKKNFHVVSIIFSPFLSRIYLGTKNVAILYCFYFSFLISYILFYLVYCSSSFFLYFRFILISWFCSFYYFKLD